LASVTVVEATKLEPQWLPALKELLAQLSSTAGFDEALIHDMIAADSTRLFLAMSGANVVGMSVLAHYATASGRRAHIEDVVVSSEERGRGIGADLVNAMLKAADVMKCRSVELTSRPSREAAIRLYQRSGFTVRDTLVLRYTPGSGR
jgi:ribosomal protein S18 acetylase RimI-like enzyme